jgi:hypothetical protein
MRSATEYDDDRICPECRAKARMHIKILSRRVVELTCSACKSSYQLPRFPVTSDTNRLPLD